MGRGLKTTRHPVQGHINKRALVAITINKRNDPKLNMTPKQVTHVTICQRLLLKAQQPQWTSMFVIKMTNPVKA